MPANRPIVLGIDPGTRVTGYGVITQDGTRLIHLASGVIKASPNDPIEKRLRIIHDRLLTIIRDNSPTVVAVEGVFYSKNAKSAISLAHARGVALLAAAEMHLPVTEYAPMEVKRATVGYGRATKDQVCAMIHHLFRLAPREAEHLADAFDALAVALCHLNTARTESRVTTQTVRSRLEVPS